MNYSKQALQRVLDLLRSLNLEALLIEHSTDLLYLTGHSLSAGRLLITSEEGPSLFVDGRYFEACSHNASYPVYLSAHFGAGSPFAQHMSSLHLKNLGFDAQTTSYLAYTALSSLAAELTPLHSPIKNLRAQKFPEEIEALKQAAKLGSEGYDFLLDALREGITELELSAALQIFWLQRGAQALAFTPIIAFGENSSRPHHRPSHRALRQGDIVLMDIGVVLNHYHSDMTRVAFFGTPDAKQDNRLVEIYHVVKEAQKSALSLCRAGVKAADLAQQARAHIDQAGYGNYFPHGLGHGIGLEIHEFPVIKEGFVETLKSGMAITIEPGIYLPDLGGVRIEDSIILTETGYDNLTQRPLPETEALPWVHS